MRGKGVGFVTLGVCIFGAEKRDTNIRTTHTNTHTYTDTETDTDTERKKMNTTGIEPKSIRK